MREYFHEDGGLLSVWTASGHEHQGGSTGGGSCNRLQGEKESLGKHCAGGLNLWGEEEGWAAYVLHHILELLPVARTTVVLLCYSFCFENCGNDYILTTFGWKFRASKHVNFCEQEKACLL